MSSYVDEEENAASLSFGKEFQDSDSLTALMNDEVLVLLSNQPKSNDPNETLKQTLDYIMKVASSTDTNMLQVSTTEIRTALEGMDMRLKIGSLQKMAPFEIASLANLVSTDVSVEEALAWIPSLTQYDDESLVLALEYISNAKSRLEL